MILVYLSAPKHELLHFISITDDATEAQMGNITYSKSHTQ